MQRHGSARATQGDQPSTNQAAIIDFGVKDLSLDIPTSLLANVVPRRPRRTHAYIVVPRRPSPPHRSSIEVTSPLGVKPVTR